MNEEILVKLNSILKDVFVDIDLDSLDRDEPLQDQIYYDSLAVMNMVVMIKRRLDVKVSPEEIKLIKSYNDLLRIVTDKSSN